jgi:hypothetical protein
MDKIRGNAKSANLLLAAAPQPFKTTEAVTRCSVSPAGVSRDPEAFSILSQAFTRILAEGKVHAQPLNEMSIAIGIRFDLPCCWHTFLHDESKRAEPPAHVCLVSRYFTSNQLAKKTKTRFSILPHSF